MSRAPLTVCLQAISTRMLSERRLCVTYFVVSSSGPVGDLNLGVWASRQLLLCPHLCQNMRLFGFQLSIRLTEDPDGFFNQRFLMTGGSSGRLANNFVSRIPVVAILQYLTSHASGISQQLCAGVLTSSMTAFSERLSTS